jgi:hypothetical protein
MQAAGTEPIKSGYQPHKKELPIGDCRLTIAVSLQHSGKSTHRRAES